MLYINNLDILKNVLNVLKDLSLVHKVNHVSNKYLDAIMIRMVPAFPANHLSLLMENLVLCMAVLSILIQGAFNAKVQHKNKEISVLFHFVIPMKMDL